MTRQRVIIQMAFATDFTGCNLQGAAREAMKRAMSQADLPLLDVLNVSPERREMRVTLGVPVLNEIDQEALEAVLPPGDARLICVLGGQSVVDPETGARLHVVTAAAEVFLSRPSGWCLRPVSVRADVASPPEAP